MKDVEYEPADILIYLQGRGLALKEKSLLAYDTVDGKITAFGSEAEHIGEGVRGRIQIISPLRQGMIADYVAAVKLFACLLHKALGRKPFPKPGIVVCTPKGMTEVGKKALEDAIYQAGARKVLISDMPAELFVREMPQQLPKLYRKFKIIIGITKDDPETYIKEQLGNILRYGEQEGIGPERVAELLNSVKNR